MKRIASIILVWLSLQCPLARAEAEASTLPPNFQAGVQAYRDGQYKQAESIFSGLHKQYPEEARITYYLAISNAQLGRFKQARALYQEVLLLNPNGESSQLAQEGLNYLPPDENKFDRPPRFQQAQTSSKTEQPSEVAPQAPASATYNDMSPQEMMALQMIMSQMGGSNNNQSGMNPWAMMMMPQATGDPNNPYAPKIDPSVMSNMLMQQMMQNFSLDGNNSKDN